jgi:hypothetical protein
MLNSVSRPTLTRRRITQLSGMAVGSLALSSSAPAAEVLDVTLEIAPYTLEASPKHPDRGLEAPRTNVLSGEVWEHS